MEDRSSKVGSPESRLRRDVEALATPMGRQVGSPGHAAARRFLEERLGEVGLEPYEGDSFALPYRDGGVEFANLVGVVPGRARELPPILVGAHYDTAGRQPGADDNAAAVAIALELAARTMGEPAERDLVVALFDAEEPPYFHTPAMGSTRFRGGQQRGPVHVALVMDLVGHTVPLPGSEDLLFITGMESDPGLERCLLATTPAPGVRVVTALNRYVGDMSDHHAFRLGRTPYLFLTCGRWEHYHSPSDTPEKLDYAKMGAVASLLERLVHDLARRELVGPWEGYDTTPTDLAFMRAALGPLARGLGIELESRADIERLAAVLMGRFRL